jgi:anti-anti-sigma regulatory factor
MSERFDLPAELTIYTVPATRDALLAWIRLVATQDSPVDICGAGVEEVDGAGLQLLGALQRTLEGSGRRWTLSQPSAALQDVARTLGCPMGSWSGQDATASTTGVAP